MSEENSSDILFEQIDRKAERLRGYYREEERALECNKRLEFSWIYHDFAIEGMVLSYPELNSSMDERIVSDNSLIPAYEDVQNHKEAIRFIRSTAAKRKLTIDGDYLKQLHQLLSTERSPRTGKAPPKPPAGQYRKDMPLHRLYFHEITTPDKIAYRVRKFVQWLTDDVTRKMHPVKRAAEAHCQIISIYPWPRHSGKISRLVMNALLVHDNYPPAIVHAINRQRYYDVLRQAPNTVADLVGESLDGTLNSALQFFGETIPEDGGVTA